MTGALDAVVTTTSITLSFDKIQNGDILVPANPDPTGKRPLKQRKRERERERERELLLLLCADRFLTGALHVL